MARPLVQTDHWLFYTHHPTQTENTDSISLLTHWSYHSLALSRRCVKMVYIKWPGPSFRRITGHVYMWSIFLRDAAVLKSTKTVRKVPTLFPKWNSRNFQGLIKDKITFFKHYQIALWYIVNNLYFFWDDITCLLHPITTFPIETMDHRISSDRRFDDKITHFQAYKK